MLSPTTVTTLPLRKGKEALAAVKREKGRERERERERERFCERTTFCSIMYVLVRERVFDIFLLLPAIIMQYLLNLV